MPKKEDVGYGIIGIFLLVAVSLVVLMLPYEPLTTYAVADTQSLSGILAENLILVTAVSIVLIMVIAGAVFLVKKHRERERILAGIPHEALERVDDYIKHTLAEGYSKEEIQKALVEAGWQEKQAEALLHHI